MENGVGMVDDSIIVDNKVVDERVASEKVVEAFKTKDVEDEVFAEATETQENLTESAELGDVAGAIENGKTIGDSSVEEVNENSDSAPEAESFEEAIGVPIEAQESLQELTESAELGDSNGVASAIENGETIGASGLEEGKENSNSEPEAESFEEVIGVPIETQESLQELTESAELGDGNGVASAIENGETIGASGLEEGKENSNSEPEAESFEEVIGVPIETQDSLQELTESAKPGDGNGVASAIGNGETIGESGLEEGKENSNSEPEAETFEKAIGVPNDVGLEEDVAASVDEQKVEKLLGSENVGEGVVSDMIDEGGTETGAETDATNNGKEVSESSGPKGLRDKDEVHMMSDAVTEKHINGDTNIEYLEGTLETSEFTKVQEDVKMDSKLGVLPQVGEGDKSREDALATDYQDKVAGAFADSSADMIVTEIEAVSDKSADVDTGDQRKESTELKGAETDRDSVDGGDEGASGLGEGKENSNSEPEAESFEEVIGVPIETQESLQELTESAEPEDGNGVASAIENGETIGDSGLEEGKENSNSEPEAETFEEAIGVPNDVGLEEDVAPSVDEQKVEKLLGSENVGEGVVSDKIDDGGIEIGAETDETNNGKEVSESSAPEVLRDKDEVHMMSYAVTEKHINGDTAIEHLEGTLETSEVTTVQEDVKMDSKLEVLPQVGEGEKSREDALATDYQDKMAGAFADSSTDMIVTEIGAVDDKSADVYTGDQRKESMELKGAETERDSVDGGDEDEKAYKALVTSETVDNRNEEVKDSSDAGEIKYNGAIDKLKDAPSELSAYVEGTVAREFGNFLSSEKFSDQKNEKIEVGKTNLRSEVHDGFQSQLPDETVNKAQNIHSVTEESEVKAEKDQEDKQSTKVTLDQEVQHASVSTLSSKVEESGKNADIVQELKQNIPVIREPETQPAPVSSSSVRSMNSATAPHPAGLGRAAPLFEPAPRVVQQPRVNGTVSQVQAQQNEDPANGEAEESDETREKLQLIRVKFLRLADRLGQRTPHNVVVAQVLYRLGLAEQLRGRNGGRVGASSFDRASAMAEQLEAAGSEPLDFSCTIMVLGKTGVGKSATINSIFDEVKFATDAFQTGTKKVQDVVGTVHGIKLRIIDTPGLLPSWSDQRQNEKTLHSIKRFIKKTPPDIVLYLDRLDAQSRDFGDMPLLRTITEVFGPSIWFNAIVVLTHAASAPPDGLNGIVSNYDMFVTQRTHVVQQAIRQAAGDMRLMNPVSLVENHSACRTNRAGQRVLPNGQVWKPNLLLLSFASKILAEANTLLKLQDTPPGKSFSTRSRTPPLPFLLSSLLQSRPQVKLPEEQYGDEDSLDDDLVESSDSEDESEYDELPPFKSLTKAQIAKLAKTQKKAYFDELEYREKLFMKKQLKEEKRQRRMMKKMAAAAKDQPSEHGDNAEEENSGASSVPVPMPDLALPASFDSDNPTHRYRYLDSSNPWLVRPVLDTHGWDHDIGYEGINVERSFVAKEKFPISFSGQITKDKKDANVQMELASCLKHGEGKATSLGFDMQTVGKDLAYTLRSETRFFNYRKNKANAGISVTLLGDTLSAGAKVEDKLIANKRFQVVMTGGAMTSRGDIAYGGSLEAQLRDKDYPLGRSSSTLGLSIMDWHGDLAIGCNIQSQVPVGRSTNLIARANLNNKGAGQISVRLNSSEQLQLALVSLLPLLRKLLEFPQQMQYGQ